MPIDTIPIGNKELQEEIILQKYVEIFHSLTINH